MATSARSSAFWRRRLRDRAERDGEKTGLQYPHGSNFSRNFRRSRRNCRAVGGFDRRGRRRRRGGTGRTARPRRRRPMTMRAVQFACASRNSARRTHWTYGASRKKSRASSLAAAACMARSSACSGAALPPSWWIALAARKAVHFVGVLHLIEQQRQSRRALAESAKRLSRDGGDCPRNRRRDALSGPLRRAALGRPAASSPSAAQKRTVGSSSARRSCCRPTNSEPPPTQSAVSRMRSIGYACRSAAAGRRRGAAETQPHVGFRQKAQVAFCDDPLRGAPRAVP